MYVQTRNCGSESRKTLPRPCQPTRSILFKSSQVSHLEVLFPLPFVINYFNFEAYPQCVIPFTRFTRKSRAFRKSGSSISIFQQLEVHRRTKVLTWLYASPILALSLRLGIAIIALLLRSSPVAGRKRSAAERKKELSLIGFRCVQQRDGPVREQHQSNPAESRR